MDGASWFKGLSYPGGTDWSYPLLGGPKGHSANTSLYTSPEGLLTMFQVASSGDLPDPGTELRSPALADGFFTTEPPVKPQ